MIPSGSGYEPAEVSYEPDPFTGSLLRITTTPEGGEEASTYRRPKRKTDAEVAVKTAESDAHFHDWMKNQGWNV